MMVSWAVEYSQIQVCFVLSLSRDCHCSSLNLSSKYYCEHCIFSFSPSFNVIFFEYRFCLRAFWEVDYVQEFATLKASGSQLDHLMRCDGLTDDDGSVQPPVIRLQSCVLAQGTKVHEICCFPTKTLSGKLCLNILLFVLMPIFCYRLFPKILLGQQPYIFYTNISTTH